MATNVPRTIFISILVLIITYHQPAFTDQPNRHLYETSKKALLSTVPRHESNEKLERLGAVGMSEACADSSTKYVTALASLQTQGNVSEWVLKMFDSTGKPPTGILDGNFQWMGSFSECLKIKVLKDNSTDVDFKGKYCTGPVLFNSENEFLNPNTHVGAGSPAGLPTNLPVTLGICWPSSCTANETAQQVNSYLVTLLQLNNVKITLADQDCYTDDPRAFDTTSIVILVVFCLFALLMVLGTAYEVVTNIQRRRSCQPLLTTEVAGRGLIQRILVSFSVYKNGKKLLNVSQSEGTLTCIHGIRFISMSWVVLGHTYALAMQMPLKNMIAITDVVRDLAFDAILNGPFSVDTFFFLSGFLVAYLFLKEMKKTGGDFGPWKIFLFYFHRYWRLTPAFAMGMAFVAGLFNHVANGPSWNDAVKASQDSCREYWWRNLLYIQNLYGFENMCYIVSWYLGCDMQFYVVSLLIIYPLYKMQKLGLVILGAFFLATTITPGLIIHINNIPGFLTADLGDSNGMEFMNKVYIKPWCRMGPYIVGIFLAVILHYTTLKVKLHPAVVAIGWILAAILGLELVYGNYYYFTGDLVMSNAHRSVYGALTRSAWGVVLAWVVFACVTGYGGYINTLLSWKAFVPLSRLTYSTYLIHIYVMYTFFSSQQTPIYFTHFIMTIIFLGILAISMGLAFVFSLAFEAPMMELEKIILRQGTSHQCAKPSRDTEIKNSEKTDLGISSNNKMEEQPSGQYENCGYQPNITQTS